MNYLSLRALQQADNVRTQLQRNMERFDIDLVSLSDEKKLTILPSFLMPSFHPSSQPLSFIPQENYPSVANGCSFHEVLEFQIPILCIVSRLRNSNLKAESRNSNILLGEDRFFGGIGADFT